MKEKKVYICSSCGAESIRHMGQCSQCREWNTLEEKIMVKTPLSGKIKPGISSHSTPRKLKEVNSSNTSRFSTGMSEFDRVLGSGVVVDGVVILTAAPGTGKSTLLTQLSQNVASSGKKVLYISGEESEEQVKARAERLFGTIHDNFWIVAETNMDNILLDIAQVDPEVVIMDSIQTVYLNEYLPSRVGNGTQVVECANALISVAKRDKRAVFIVGHLTKGEELAGPRMLEHMVDTVLYLEGEDGQELRFLRAQKNRFGDTSELGIFTMQQSGLEEILNPSQYFLSPRKKPVSGVAITTIMEGNRVLTVEITSLVEKATYGTPMRNTEGITSRQLQTLSAIADKRVRANLRDSDIFVKVLGGLTLREPAANLAVIAAIVSSATNKPIPFQYVFIGEVSLTGEILKIPSMEKRIRELDRFFFKKVFIPKGALSPLPPVKNIEIVELEDLDEMIKKLFL